MGDLWSMIKGHRMTMVAFLEPLTRVISHRHGPGRQVYMLANSVMLKAEEKTESEDTLTAKYAAR